MKNTMKKLMIAVATAAVFGGTYADLCDPETQKPAGCSVYNVKFTFKTLAAKKACSDGAKWLVTSGGAFGGFWLRDAGIDAKAGKTDATRTLADYLAIPAGDNTLCDGRPLTLADRREVYWMDNGTRRFDGVLWQCAAQCFEGIPEDCSANNNGRINFALWEKKSSRPISLPVFQYKYGTDDNGDKELTDKEIKSQGYASYNAADQMWLARYGQKAQKVSMYWMPSLRLGQSIDAAGFGSFDAKNLRIKSVNGNAVGLLAPLNAGASDKCGNPSKIFCAVGFMCVEWKDWCCDGCYAGVELVPASGTWSVKYNASATKKANAGKATLASLIPAYMFYATSTFWADARALDPWLHTDGFYHVDTTGALLYKVPEGEGSDTTITLDGAISLVAWKNEQVCNILDMGVKFVDPETKEVTYMTKDGKSVAVKDGVLDFSSTDEDTGL